MKPVSVTWTIRVSNPMRQKIELAAKRNFRSLSSQILYMLSEYIREHPEQFEDRVDTSDIGRVDF